MDAVGDSGRAGVPAAVSDAYVVPAVSGIPPTTARGQRTRERLIAGARRVFERDGFLAARIADITAEAGVAYGTFYTYFPTKEAAFTAAVTDLQHDLMRADSAPEAGLTLAARVERANRLYLEGYQRNTGLMAVLEEVCTFNENLRGLRRDVRRRFVDRSAAAIRRWQRDGLADPELDAYYAASALGSMVDRFAYVWLVLEEDFELEPAVRTLTRLFMSALRLPDGPDDRGEAAEAR